MTDRLLVGLVGPITNGAFIMKGKDIKLTRRRLLGGIATVGAAGAAAGAGTFALFSDNATSDSNQITAGTLSIGGTTSGVIDVSALAPGDTIPADGSTTTISADYTGTIDPVVDIAVSVTGTQALAEAIDVDTAKLVRDDGSVNEEQDLTSSPGVSSLWDLNGLDENGSFGSVTDGDEVGLELGLSFPESVSDDTLQGESVTINVTFDARQPGSSP